MDGWELEVVRDESDFKKRKRNSKHTTPLEQRLKGCSFLKESRNNQAYTAEIRYEERSHNLLVYVEAVVMHRKHISKEITTKDLELFNWKEFEGTDAKRTAAMYALSLKEMIEKRYFANGYTQLPLPF